VRIIYLLFIVMMTASCHHRRMVTARSEFLDASYLASTKIETPDPCKQCFLGQQLVITWNVPSRKLPAEIDLQIRYGNRQFQQITHPIQTPAGYWTFRLMNKEYSKMQGICAYSVQIVSDGCVIDRWDHHLWADLVQLPSHEDDKVSLLLEPRIIQ
jgi:hypothetical protein